MAELLDQVEDLEQLDQVEDLEQLDQVEDLEQLGTDGRCPVNRDGPEVIRGELQ